MKYKALITSSLALPLLLVGAVNVEAQQTPGNTDKVRICHRTNSATNPYTSIEVDSNAADGVSGNSTGNPNDHYGEHQGPLVTSEADAQAKKDAKQEWGDIIPPISPHHSGLNWTAEGQAMYNNGCNYVTPGRGGGETVVTTTTGGGGGAAQPQVVAQAPAAPQAEAPAGGVGAGAGGGAPTSAVALAGLGSSVSLLGYAIRRMLKNDV